VAKSAVIEEFHVTMKVPHEMDEREVRAIRRTMAAPRFRRQFQRAAHDCLRRYPTLAQVRTTVSW
jgi:hypothetical protein